LLVEWNELEVNVVLQPEQFVIEIPPGLGRCGQQAPAAGAPAGATSK
jgi:hypothetical protein